MSSFAQMAHDNRNAAVKAVQDLYELAATEGRDLSAEETEQAERMEADITNWAQKRDSALRAEKLAIEAATARGENELRIERPDTRTDARPTEFDLFKRGIQMAKAGGMFVYDLARDGGNEYTETRSANPGEYRTLTVAGGTAVATEFSNQVIMYLRTATPLLRPEVVTLLDTADGHPIQFPRLTADPSTGGTVVAAGGTITEGDPTISSVTLNSFKYGYTNLLQRELVDDALFDIQGLVAKSTARSLGIDINAHLATGTGTTQPNGIVTAATAGFTATGTASGTSLDTFFSPADLLDLYYSLPDAYRTGGNVSWMASGTGVAKMRKFRDNNKQFIWDPSLVAGQPDRFNGAPVFENAAMVAVASATKSVIVGDLSAYYVRVVPLRVEISRDYKFSSDLIAVRSILRVDGNLPDAAAIRSLVSANT